ncbi:monovalent cation/H+ antiporter complex subunit F [Bartonella sp. DGB1]|uniref:monovalent cation/H+ antiporter complex subunit F n=1 Tax=Bartonella sp. DGB1 TaxID=3239807 RepID=UPI003525E779
MNFWIIEYTAIISEFLLCISIAIISYQIITAPDTAGRLIGMDFLYLILSVFTLILAIYYQTTYYWNIAFIICLLGFIISTIFTKFLLKKKAIDK